MHTLKLSVSLPDDGSDGIELRLSANEADCDVLIALPRRAPPTAATDGDRELDDYVLGGYAGI